MVAITDTSGSPLTLVLALADGRTAAFDRDGNRLDGWTGDVAAFVLAHAAPDCSYQMAGPNGDAVLISAEMYRVLAGAERIPDGHRS